MPPRVKICCIASIAEARMAIAFGADAIGLVGRMPSGPGPIDDALIAEIASFVQPPTETFLLTSETDTRAIAHHHSRTCTTTVQIVDALARGNYDDLRIALPGVKLVQVIHVRDDRSVDEALAAAEHVDHLLLDSGNPDLHVKELGGTGRVHDWRLSRRIVEQAKVPVYLAGGLRHENVREAIEQVQPYGVDLCSGVRTNGKLDPEKLERFFAAVNAG